jgi:hypothetical protein
MGRRVVEVEGERVQVDAGVAQVDDGAADGVGEAGVLVLRVEHDDLDAVVELAQEIQLGQVRLAGAGTGKGDGVVVVPAPAVPDHQPGWR